MLVGADGANSTVAKALFGRAYDPARIGFALEVELPRIATEAGRTGRDRPWGDGLGLWLGLSQGRVGDAGGRRGPSPQSRPARHVRTASQRRHGADLTRLRCKGAFLPFGEVRPVPGKGRVLLAGDAAGLVDPITGEGIAWAMKSGHLAASAAVQSPSCRANPTPRWATMRRACARSRPNCAARGRCAGWPISPGCSRPSCACWRAEPGLQRRYLALLAGDLDYADLGWRALPRLGLRLLRRARRRVA